MTTFTHQRLSRKTSTPEVSGLTMRVRIFQPRCYTCPSLCCAWAMQKSFSFNQTES